MDAAAVAVGQNSHENCRRTSSATNIVIIFQIILRGLGAHRPSHHIILFLRRPTLKTSRVMLTSSTQPEVVFVVESVNDAPYMSTQSRKDYKLAVDHGSLQHPALPAPHSDVVTA